MSSVTSFAHIKRCLELGDRDVETALEERSACKALLEQLAKISKPADGAAKLLIVFARVAGAQVDWIDGALRIELAGDATSTSVEVLSELGLGMHERVFPSFKMAVPLDEFARAIERVPHMIAPLAVASKGPRRLVLAVGEGDGAGDEAPVRANAFAIADDSLYDSSRKHPIAPMPIVAVDKERDVTVAPGRARVAPKTSDAPRSAPKVIAARSGNTLPIPMPRAAPSIKPRATPPPLPPSGKPPSVRAKAAPPPLPPSKPTESMPPAAKPIEFPRPPALPRTGRALETGSRSVVGRVALKQVEAARASSPASGNGRASRPPAARKSKPPGRSSKPPSARASKPPSARHSKPPTRPSKPPPSARKRDVSEAPDEESIDKGWEDD